MLQNFLAIVLEQKERKDLEEKERGLSWNQEAGLVELLRSCCKEEYVPEHLKGNIAASEYANYSLEHVDVKTLLQVSSPRLLSQTSGVDYAPLRALLALGKWREANKETFDRMIEAAKQEKQGYLDKKDIEVFPCEDLQMIDRLWVKYSDGKFGFSVQKRIWQECGSPGGYSNGWERFGDRVGWRKGEEWVWYDELLFDPKKSLVGELPAFGEVGRVVTALWTVRGDYSSLALLFSRATLLSRYSSLAQRLANCNIQ